MTYGIAAYKVTPHFCEDEVNYITSLGGIEIKYDQELGKNCSLADLQKNYDAVYLGFGVGLARQLDIPGEELEGVVDAISFIYNIRAGGYAHVPVGDKVVVIGMGMTAIDAATQAKRLGAKEVTIVYRRTQSEMPCTDAELDIAKLDGCRIIWLAAPQEIIGDGLPAGPVSPEASAKAQATAKAGKVKNLICRVMELGEPDASGRRSPVETAETFTLEVDMVIKAAGQIPFEEMVSSNQLQHAKGKISIGINGATNIKGVFAGGDCVNGGKEVVDAVQAGKVGAKAIVEYLNSMC